MKKKEQDFGLYLAIEGIEDGFLQRNYGKDYGELPDGFDMSQMPEGFDPSQMPDFSGGFPSSPPNGANPFGNGTMQSLNGN